jgi:DNA-binding response OmpR family regulator
LPKKSINISKGNETILLVEDEKMIQDFVKQVLEYNGYNVLTADDGKE